MLWFSFVLSYRMSIRIVIIVFKNLQQYIGTHVGNLFILIFTLSSYHMKKNQENAISEPKMEYFNQLGHLCHETVCISKENFLWTVTKLWFPTWIICPCFIRFSTCADIEVKWSVCLTSQLTIFQSYMWRHIDVQADWRSWTYGRAPNAIDIS